MEGRIKEFINQLNTEIKKTEKYLNEAKENLKESINQDYNIVKFGLAKEAEEVTKLAVKLQTLQEQKQRFEFIFEIGGAKNDR